MNSSSAQIGKRCGPQRKQVGSHQAISEPQRRSSRLQSRQVSVSILHSFGTYYRPQDLSVQLPTDSNTSHPVGTVSHKCLSNSDLVKASALKPSREKFQDKPFLPQPYSEQTRKRRQDGIEPPPKRARLTKNNLKSFERMAGRARQGLKSKTTHSRKSSQFEPSSSRSDATSKLSKTSDSSSKTVSTTDSSFPRLVFGNGVYDPLNSAPPQNLGYIQDRLNRARDTESPTESQYQDFVYRTQEAPNEQTMLLETSKLLKEYGRGYRQVYNQALHDFPKSVGFNTGRQELGGATVPSSDNNATTLPHLAGEWKAARKDMVQARTQAAYDGACMVYGRNEARLFIESPDPADYAYVQTFTTDGTTLNTFAHYSSESQGQPKYHQYPTSSSFLISSYKDFKQSRRRLRNQQDDAKEYSEKLRDELNMKWEANQHQLPVATSLSTGSPVGEDDYDDQEDGEGDPSRQLLGEHRASLNEQDEYNPPGGPQPLTSDYVHNPVDSPAVLSAAFEYNQSDYPQPLGTDNRYIPYPSEDRNPSYGSQQPDASTYSPITPPHSSEYVSLPADSQMLSFSAAAKKN